MQDARVTYQASQATHSDYTPNVAKARMAKGPSVGPAELFAHMIETHDADTIAHFRRTNEYSHFLAVALGMKPAFCDELRRSALFHDVGKLALDRAVLYKAGELDDRERAEIERHPSVGHAMLEPMNGLDMAAEIALFHHEKWDGTGYPRGLAGEAIPIAARIVAVADVYDALRSPRPYKPAYSHHRACSIMMNGDHRLDPEGHFDPEMLALFSEVHRDFDAIYRRYGGRG